MPVVAACSSTLGRPTTVKSLSNGGLATQISNPTVISQAAKDETTAQAPRERKSLQELGLEIDLVPPRYRSTYFNHIFSGPAGYSAGYYSYLWTQMLDHDSRDYILARGGLTREMGTRLREQVLSRGGTMDYDVVYRNFAERDPDVKYMLRSLGLTDS